MDLLAAYGSDSEHSGNEAEYQAPEPKAPSLPPPPPVAPITSLADLPIPQSERQSFFPGLPKAPLLLPVRRKRIPPKFGCGIEYGDALDGGGAGKDKEEEEEEEEEADRRKKKMKQGNNSRGLSLAEFLPPPKNAKGGASGGGGGGTIGGGGVDVDDDDIIPGADDPVAMFLGNKEEEDEGDDAPVPPLAPLAPPPSLQPQQRHVRGEYNGQEYIYDTVTGQYYYPEQEPQQQQPHYADDASFFNDGNQHNDQQPRFKEINAAELRYMAPGQRAEINAMRSALGDDYEVRLKSEAAKVGSVSQLAKRRHQLSSLYVQAKEQELEDIEKKVGGATKKAETKRKYGW